MDGGFEGGGVGGGGDCGDPGGAVEVVLDPHPASFGGLRGTVGGQGPVVAQDRGVHAAQDPGQRHLGRERGQVGIDVGSAAAALSGMVSAAICRAFHAGSSRLITRAQSRGRRWRSSRA